MSLLKENVIPGNHGKVFETDAKEHQDLLKIKEAISNINGIIDVIVDENDFPKQITVHTSTLVKVKEIEDTAIRSGFHLIPKSLFEL